MAAEKAAEYNLLWVGWWCLRGMRAVPSLPAPCPPALGQPAWPGPASPPPLLLHLPQKCVKVPSLRDLSCLSLQKGREDRKEGIKAWKSNASQKPPPFGKKVVVGRACEEKREASAACIKMPSLLSLTVFQRE